MLSPTKERPTPLVSIVTQAHDNGGGHNDSVEEIHVANDRTIEINYNGKNEEENGSRIPSSNSTHIHSNDAELEQISQNIYQVVRANGGRLLMSQIASKYLEMFGKPLNFDGNPKYFVRMERLLSDDVMLYHTPEPAYKLVVSILKQNATNGGTGMPVSQFREQLEQRMGMTLDGCDFSDFLMRWRFLSIRENPDGTKFVLFTPHSGSTVFFGNLNVSCKEEDIYSDLEKVDPLWRNASVRLKLGKGFSYAFVLRFHL
ncbi:hypothetical protein RFI_24948 [Reticulomyxa filosa]|uniref:Uncharacterized protein n=1 Tax=Reticulomyxa filosa TaxID=46433 RepID=X6MGA0_RETFI|nr:hypothetical protein RFI_24948 [Reticulomyxa filosa]|eukprot:ETO12427.1 hypothetical protein RFI_24948 [Reticulomyxa filosa]